MKRLAGIAFPLLCCGLGLVTSLAPSVAQSTPPAGPSSNAQVWAQPAAARQGDVEQLARALYATHLDDGSWTRHDREPCNKLPHHRFALFTQTPTGGAIARFFAVYDLDAAPRRSAKPWQRGILLLRLSPRPEKGLGTGTSDPNLLAAFNRVLEQEHAIGPAIAPAAHMSVDELANCFLAATGEVRVPVVVAENLTPRQSPAPSTPITGIMVPLVSPPGYTRTENLRFDEHGLITRADVLVQYIGR